MQKNQPTQRVTTTVISTSSYRKKDRNDGKLKHFKQVVLRGKDPATGKTISKTRHIPA